MITVNNSIYISAQSFICITDKYLNIINLFDTTPNTNRGLYFNSSNNTIYVTKLNNNRIDVFDLNLTRVDSISTSTYQPWSIQGYKNYIYVGTNSGQLIVIYNKVINQTVTVCNGTLLSSIQIDHYGYMALSCYNDKKAYLYYSANLSYTGIFLTYTVTPYFINLDSNSRFVVISRYQIDIYNS